MESSTIPQAGPIALQGTAGAGPGSRLLVNGAGGGSGSFAIQIAKRLGAHVTGVDNAAKLEFIRSVGADVALDHRSEDFTRTGQRYDLILDLVAHRSMFAYRRALAAGGRYRCVGGTTRALTVGFVAGRATGRRMGVLAVEAGSEHFTPLTDLIVAGDVIVHIDRTSDRALVAEHPAHALYQDLDVDLGE